MLGTSGVLRSGRPEVAEGRARGCRAGRGAAAGAAVPSGSVTAAGITRREFRSAILDARCELEGHPS